MVQGPGCAFGAVVQVWPIETQRLPAWIRQRLHSAGIEPTGEVVQMLAERVEGESAGGPPGGRKASAASRSRGLDADQLEVAVADSSRYDVFELVDSALRGEVERSVRILTGCALKGWHRRSCFGHCTARVRNLAQMSADVAKGASPDQAIGRPACSASASPWSARVRAGCARRSGCWRWTDATRPMPR